MRGDGSRPCASVLPLAGTSSEAEAGRVAWGRRRGKGAAAQPIAAAAGARPSVSPPPPSAFLLPLSRTGVHTLGRGRGPSGEDALTHSGRLHPFVPSRIGGWWVVGRRRGTRPAREKEEASLKTPLSRAAKVHRAPRPLTAFFGRGPSGLPRRSVQLISKVYKINRSSRPSPPTRGGSGGGRGGKLSQFPVIATGLRS